MSTPIIYGIPNCDTIKKTFTWFKANKIDFIFHNYKTDGIAIAKLKAWCKYADWQLLLNKKSSTWRNTDPATQSSITTQAAAIKLMQLHTSLIKRPVIECNNGILIGYNEADLEKQFLKK
ncbi:MAG: Spx/MgsR family RNA polymerase-binding regulatory protein [Bacteroidetes bacterium]|nr:Spx/MgsR family RNA polymerase-binding regulatory protein [Bacteroidota bacterium]MBS1756244.1 Spx/MgsR family RNA polymerase-binding regulatory protein [Bacteroidota bacterium]